MKSVKTLILATFLAVSVSAVTHAGTITGSKTTSVGTITGSSTGTITGSRTGTITGSRTGTITGSRTGTITGSRFDDNQSLSPDLGTRLLTRAFTLVLDLIW